MKNSITPIESRKKLVPQLSIRVFSEIGELTVWVELALAIGSFVVGLATVYWKFKPKSKTVSSSTYIDLAKGKLVEIINYDISLGWRIFGTSVKLPRLPRISEYELYCKPLASPQETLQPELYEENKKGNRSTITLTANKYMREREITKVSLVTHTNIKRSSFRNKVTQKFSDDTLEITNNNMEEIKNYSIKLPARITMSRLRPIPNQITDFVPSKSKSQGILIHIDIPAKVGDSPGRKILA